MTSDTGGVAPKTPSFENEVDTVLSAIGKELIAKNRKYGDSALNPKRVFSKASAIEQLKVRLDDKISRLASGQQDEDEDVEQDLMGYLVLLRIARNRMNNTNIKPSEQVRSCKTCKFGKMINVACTTCTEKHLHWEARVISLD